jgi:chromosome segregation ATPase
MNKNLQLVSTIVPLLIVAVGLIGWVFTLRADITSAQTEIVEVRRELQLVSQESRQAQLEITKFTNQIDGLIEEINNNSPAIEKLKTDMAIANDQMRTIMSDHAGFGDALKEIGQASALPSGERRDYGGYGGY